jgi:hypothetical protein
MTEAFKNGIILFNLNLMRYLVLIILISIASCSKKQEPKPDIFSIKEMSDLATVEYTVTKIIKANDNKTWFKIGDRKILMSCEAHIKAGIDLSNLTENNFTIQGKSISVQLPSPKVISLSIPPEKIKTEYEDVGMFRDKFTSNDRNALAVQAETQIKNSIDSLGILQQAKVNTSLLVSNFLKRLGYENIHITYGDAKPSIANP